MPEFSYTPPEVSAILGLVETHLRMREMNGPDRGYEIYHPSSFGKCLRLMQYQRYEARGLIKGEPEVFNGQKLRLFENGHVMHDRWRNYFEALGVLKGVWVCQNPLCRVFDNDSNMIANVNQEAEKVAKSILADAKTNPPRIYGDTDLQGVFKPSACVCGCKSFKYEEVLVQDKELNFRGHADIILDFSRFDYSQFSEAEKKGLTIFFEPEKLPKGVVVVDMKTVGVNSYKNTVLKTGYHTYYGIQLTIYVNILQCDYGLLLYEEKDQFDLAAFRIDKNPGAWAKIREQALAMNDMASDEKPKLPPPRPISKSSYDCADCSFKARCQKPGGIWNDPDLEQKRRDFYGDLL